MPERKIFVGIVEVASMRIFSVDDDGDCMIGIVDAVVGRVLEES